MLLAEGADEAGEVDPYTASEEADIEISNLSAMSPPGDLDGILGVRQDATRFFEKELSRWG
jgi:hypothetical protein